MHRDVHYTISRVEEDALSHSTQPYSQIQHVHACYSIHGRGVRRREEDSRQQPDSHVHKDQELCVYLWTCLTTPDNSSALSSTSFVVASLVLVRIGHRHWKSELADFSLVLPRICQNLMNNFAMCSHGCGFCTSIKRLKRESSSSREKAGKEY